jgi:hypothetical protein
MEEGATALEAAADSARSRFRPILMTVAPEWLPRPLCGQRVVASGLVTGAAGLVIAMCLRTVVAHVPVRVSERTRSRVSAGPPERGARGPGPAEGVKR